MASVTLENVRKVYAGGVEAVKGVSLVMPDGSFTVRYSLPNCRQVIPAVARSSDGLEQRTIVLAVERNTKSMEPVLREGGE